MREILHRNKLLGMENFSAMTILDIKVYQDTHLFIFFSTQFTSTLRCDDNDKLDLLLVASVENI